MDFFRRDGDYVVFGGVVVVDNAAVQLRLTLSAEPKARHP